MFQITADKMLGLALNPGLPVLERFLMPSGSPPADACKSLGVGVMGLPLLSSDHPISSFPQTHPGSDPKTVARTEALTLCQRSWTIPGP